MLSVDRKTLFEEINKVSYDWIPFENVYYSKTELAKYSFSDPDTSSFLKLDINAFLIATATHGGPFALMLNNKIVPSGAGNYKDKIIVMSAYGDRISTIEFKKVFAEAYDKEIKHWALFSFTKEEDILLISANGIVLLMDPISGEVLHRHDYQTQFTGRAMIETAKSKDNSVVLKTGTNNFYYIHDIYHPEIVDFGTPDFDLAYQGMPEDSKSASSRSANLPQRTTIDDYVVIPKSKSYFKKMEILITHPKEGLIMLDDQQKSTYTADMSQFCSDDVGRLGHITNIALSANENLLTFYSETSSWIYVFKSDMLKMLNRFDTGKPRPEKLIWCANNVPMLIYEKSITMIGPKKMQDLPLEDEDKIKGIHYCWENDGVRLITTNYIYFFERVQPSVIKALTFVSADPSNQLIDAYREYEEKSENTERIFREIENNLKEAIETVIEAATYQFYIPFQKLLCEVASFGKKKLEAEKYNSDMYVQIIRNLALINKLRYSSKCRRAITYKQLKEITPKVLMPIQLKYRDYFLVLREAKNLNLKQKYINMVYEEWACNLLKHSSRDQETLKNDIIDKLTELDSEIRAKGGSDRYNSLTGAASTIDYTKIAKVAQEVGKKEIAIQLVNYENSVIKKIPYLLSLNQFEVALEISIAEGDMNIVHKVISKILEKHGNDDAWLKEFLDKMRISHRKFITYAKQEGNLELIKKLRELMEDIYNFSEVKMLLKRENEISRLKPEERDAELQGIEESFKKVYKDSFKSGLIKFEKKLLAKQTEFNKNTKTRKFNGQSARQSIETLLKSSKQAEAKSLAKSIKMNEICYLGIEAKTFADMGHFDHIEKYLEVKKPKLPYHFLAQLCIEKKKTTLAQEFIDRVQDEDVKESLQMKMR